MPIVRVELAAGRPPELLDRLLRAVSETVVTTLQVPTASVEVIVTEVPAEQWLRGHLTVAQERARRAGATAAEPPA